MQEEDQDTAQPNVWRFALALAFGLVAIVMVLNGLGPPQIKVEQDRVDQWVEENLVRRIQLAPSGAYVHLKESVVLVEAGHRSQTELVYTEMALSPAQITSLKAKGIFIELLDEDPPVQHPWLGTVLIFGLLATSIGYLVWQALYFKRHGSPRSQLQKLEQQYKAGKLSQEEYNRLSEAQWSQL